MHLWALTYAAENRVPTTHLTDDTVIPAKNIPLTSFLPNEEELLELRKDLMFVSASILCEHMKFFRENFSAASMDTMTHDHIQLTRKRSNVVSFYHQNSNGI